VFDRDHSLFGRGLEKSVVGVSRMKERLPTLADWKLPVVLYPEGPWLQDPTVYKDYVHLVEGLIQCPDLLITPCESSQERLHAWKKKAVLESFDSLEYMNFENQPLHSSIELRTNKIWGLQLVAAETTGYRNNYQDRQVVFILPIDETDKKVMVSVLLDGHGPTQGGERVAQLLASQKGAQWLCIAMKQWSQRLEKPWDEMSWSEKENGFHFSMIELQESIRRTIVDAMHASQLAAQSKTLATTLQHTLKALSYQEITPITTLDKYFESLQNLVHELNVLESLEGVGSTAIYTFWMVDEPKDAIDVWTVSVGDSWAGCVQKNAEPSFSLVDEAVPSKAHFFEEIQARGGWVERDEYGMARLNGEYSLCRGLGDLYLIRQWAEVKACVQIRGMSPRPTVTHVRFCEKPEESYELAYENLGLWVQHCDGIKEGGTLTSDQLTNFLSKHLKKGIDLQWVSSKLIERAVKGGSQDNCTIQILDLRPLASRSFRKKMYLQASPNFGTGFFQGFV
jgi:serine/threonine protein phosphatase PrpC